MPSEGAEADRAAAVPAEGAEAGRTAAVPAEGPAAHAAPAAGEGDGPRPGARPADRAREALRAARAEARRLREEGAGDGRKGVAGGRERGGQSRRSAPSAPAPRDGTRGRTAAERARVVRELMSDAFRMPDDGEETAGRDTGSAVERGARRGSGTDVTDPAGPARWWAAAPVGAPQDTDSEPHSADSAPARLGTASHRAHATSDADLARTGSEPQHPHAASASDPAVAPPGVPPRPTDAASDPAAPPSVPPRHTPVTSAAPDPTTAPPAPPRHRTPAAASPSNWPAPATPRHPRSMAAPGRDGELRRTFPAFAARVADGTGDHGRFAETWWGNAWVEALEKGALDAKRLARGRGYAEQGNVDAITVTPGLVLAYVQGSRPRPYRVQVRLRTLDDADWERFLDAAAERTGHIAALLDKEMPHSLAEGGVRLLPGPGDLEPHCSCPDRGHPCKHAAALCYQTARLLDADPFVLLLLRGRGERELLDALSRLSAARAARAVQERGPAPLPGVRASEALAPRRLPPLPAPSPVPPHPEQPPAYPAAPGGPDPFALDQLATDAAGRAHALLATGHDPVAELTLWQDAVRLAAARPGSGLTATTRSLYAALATAADRTPADLARAVAAWRQGGFEGLAALEEPWDPPAGRFDRARPLLLAADLPAFRPWRNRLTHPRGHVQLRLGRDGLWYAYESDPGADDWWPRGTPDLDPVGALTGLGASPEG
ncbi:SWIM zinc finger family protein [Streptomyces sp. S.PB5]|uniref:SWIM zinc finger family protein n=1 Tax=Streptomyces sp. S.PB5 TaxID=3020844 RepID=UPI0025AFE9BA|nr:SWIM zinc finger family protein [Streptomyces sp. S.PB5]MDN3021847.1 SWIM zinc finger family protein [Streptomyces sp. S.PB5]